MANGWLMRPGGAMIELQPFGFDEGPASTPGEAEAAGVGSRGAGHRDRNLRVE